MPAAVSLRIRTFDSDVLKVNDAVGNPVEIAAVINWQVIDTARATFDVDDYERFVHVQAEAAIRHVASEYPYDLIEDEGPSLRANADDVTATLQSELQDRLEEAGVSVRDCRLRRLAYAAEIAGEMLRRQQAGAVIAARKLIVQRSREHGSGCPRATRRREHRRARRRTQGGHGFQPHGGSDRGSQRPARGQRRDPLSRMTERKSFLLRLNPTVTPGPGEMGGGRYEEPQRPDRVSGC